MPEYQFDPSTGTSSEVSRGGEEVKPPAIGIEEINRARVRNTAKGLADRQNHSSAAGDTADVNVEIQLQQTQQKIMRGDFNGPLEQQQLIQQAEGLAAQLVGAAEAPRLLENGDEERAPENFDEEYLNNHPEVQADLQYASEVMSESLVGEFNTMISGSDELTKVGALDTIKHLRQNPQAFSSASDSTGVDEYTEKQIAAQYGEELAHAISVLGNGVASGVITTSQAIRTASSDPDLKNALFALAQQGIIRIAL